MARIVLDTDVVSLYRAGRLPTGVARQVVTNDLLPEMARWWNRWLRGERNGVDEGPPVTVFVRHSTRPAPDLDEQPGVWRDEPAWPKDRATSPTLALGPAGHPAHDPRRPDPAPVAGGAGPRPGARGGGPVGARPGGPGGPTTPTRWPTTGS